MASLHLFSAGDLSVWAHCKASLQPGDTLLLWQEAVYRQTEIAAALPVGVTLKLLADDLQARGLAVTAETGVDYSGMVALTESHQPVISWY